jgi:hypothetical protein
MLWRLTNTATLVAALTRRNLEAIDGAATDTDTISYGLWLGEVLAGAVVAVLLFLHWLLHRVEVYARSHPHVHEILQQAYRETALLGIVSLFLFLAEAVDHSAGGTPTALHELEVIHVFVYVTAILFALWVALLLTISHFISARWRRLETEFAGSFSRYQDLKLKVAEAQGLLHVQMDELAEQPSLHAVTSYVIAFLRSPIRAAKYFHNLKQLRYMELRERFILRHGLPQHFPFFAYLNQCKAHVFIRLVDLPVVLWGATLYVLALDLYLRTVWTWYRNAFQSTEVVVAVSIFCILLGLCIRLKMQSIIWAIFHTEFARLAVDTSAVRHAGSWDDLRRSMSFKSFAGLPVPQEGPFALPQPPPLPLADLPPEATAPAPRHPHAESPVPAAADVPLTATAATVLERPRAQPLSAPAVIAPQRQSQAPHAQPQVPAPHPRHTAPHRHHHRGLPLVPAGAELVVEQPLALDEAVVATEEGLESPSAVVLDVTELARDEEAASAASSGHGSTGRASTGRASSGRASTGAASGGAASEARAPSARYQASPALFSPSASVAAPSAASSRLESPPERPQPRSGPGGDTSASREAPPECQPTAPPSPTSTSATSRRAAAATAVVAIPPAPRVAGPAPAHSSMLVPPLLGAPGALGIPQPTRDTSAPPRRPSFQLAQAQRTVGQDTVGQGTIGQGTVGQGTIGSQASFHRVVDSDEYRRKHRQHLAEQRKLFWFSSPILMLRMLQLLLFAVSLAVSLIVVFFSEVTATTRSILWAFISAGLAIVLSIFFTATVVPQYVLSIHVSDLVDVRLLADTMIWMERERHRERHMREKQRRQRAAAARQAEEQRAQARQRQQEQEQARRQSVASTASQQADGSGSAGSSAAAPQSAVELMAVAAGGGGGRADEAAPAARSRPHRLSLHAHEPESAASGGPGRSIVRGESFTRYVLRTQLPVGARFDFTSPSASAPAAGPVARSQQAARPGGGSEAQHRPDTAENGRGIVDTQRVATSADTRAGSAGAGSWTGQPPPALEGGPDSAGPGAPVGSGAAATDAQARAAAAARRKHAFRERVFEIVTSRRMQLSVTLAILAAFFLLAMTASQWLRMPGRAVAFGFEIAIVAFVTLELLVRIWATGPWNYFLRPEERIWNVFDVVLVIAAVVATVLAIAFGSITFSDANSNGRVANVGAPVYLAPLLALRLLRSSLILYVVRGPRHRRRVQEGGAGAGATGETGRAGELAQNRYMQATGAAAAEQELEGGPTIGAAGGTLGGGTIGGGTFNMDTAQGTWAAFFRGPFAAHKGRTPPAAGAGGGPAPAIASGASAQVGAAAGQPLGPPGISQPLQQRQVAPSPLGVAVSRVQAPASAAAAGLRQDTRQASAHHGRLSKHHASIPDIWSARRLPARGGDSGGAGTAPGQAPGLSTQQAAAVPTSADATPTVVSIGPPPLVAVVTETPPTGSTTTQPPDQGTAAGAEAVGLPLTRGPVSEEMSDEVRMFGGPAGDPISETPTPSGAQPRQLQPTQQPPTTTGAGEARPLSPTEPDTGAEGGQRRRHHARVTSLASVTLEDYGIAPQRKGERRRRRQAGGGGTAVVSEEDQEDEEDDEESEQHATLAAITALLGPMQAQAQEQQLQEETIRRQATSAPVARDTGTEISTVLSQPQSATGATVGSRAPSRLSGRPQPEFTASGGGSGVGLASRETLVPPSENDVGSSPSNNASPQQPGLEHLDRPAAPGSPGEYGISGLQHAGVGPGAERGASDVQAALRRHLHARMHYLRGQVHGLRQSLPPSELFDPSAAAHAHRSASETSTLTGLDSFLFAHGPAGSEAGLHTHGSAETELDGAEEQGGVAGGAAGGPEDGEEEGGPDKS